MKKGFFILLILWLITLAAGIAFYKKTNNEWEIAMANLKAYDAQLSASREQNAAYQLTIDQLEYFQDSVLVALNQTREELKIKDKNLQALQYVVSSFEMKDTVILNDTIFKDISVNVDTLIGDAWCNVQVGLKYPSTITVAPSFKSEKHIIVHTKKETVNPPKKFWLFRLFQKKHKVLHVEVVEKNPYVTNASSKYVEILK